jgi:hypothetical protein
MTVLAEARTTLATALAAEVTPQVFAFVPPVPRPPCIIVAPSTPWALPGQLGPDALEVRLKVLVVVSPRTVEAATEEAETLVDEVLQAIPAGYSLIQIAPPQLNDTGAQGFVVTTEISLSVRMKG